MGQRIAELKKYSLWFPDVNKALREPDGLLAFGGDLSTERLLEAYRQGIFPWYEEGQPVLWWSPDPRAVLYPNRFHLSRSMKKLLAKRPFTITLNKDFEATIIGCAASRQHSRGTWITSPMRRAYSLLHEQGFAHSVEAWLDGELVGGLYGIAMGKVFFGESMFSRRDNASKVAFAHLINYLISHGYQMVDCQVQSAHMQSLGAELVDREIFCHQLKQWVTIPTSGDTLPALTWQTQELCLPFPGAQMS